MLFHVKVKAFTWMEGFIINDSDNEVNLMKAHTMRMIKANNSGFAELRIYPCNRHNRRREKRYMKTLEAVRKGNKKRSFETCFQTALDNFGLGDFVVTLTFSTQDCSEIRKQYDLLIKRLQRLYSSKGQTLRYMAFWGRGNKLNHLHCHLLVNADVDKQAILSKAHGIDVDVRRISETYCGQIEQDIIRYCVAYLWSHWDSLNYDDRVYIKKRWYSSLKLNQMEIEERDDDEIDRPVKDSPSKLLKALSRARSSESIQRLIKALYPGYRVNRLGYDYGNAATYRDSFGNLFAKIELVKVGSKYDERVIEYLGYRINSVTGEVYGRVKDYKQTA